MHSQGDDTFACDGTSSEITLNGMQGDDTFIIGQVLHQLAASVI